MPRKKKTKSKKIPSYGRSYKEISKDYASLRAYSADVPIGNNNPTMVEGTLGGGVPNKSRRARGSLRQQRGRY